MERFRCCGCGRFVPWDADYSVPFMSGGDIDPPEPEYYCDSCANKYEEFWVQLGGSPPIDYILAKWERRVAERLGFVEIRLPGAAWTIWHNKRLPIPPAYVLSEGGEQ